MTLMIRMGARYHERKQLENSFIEREISGLNEEVKHPQRVKVAKFFKEKQVGKTRCFCLPGVRWAFENTLQDYTGFDTEFIGVERNYTILEKAVIHMPGYGRIVRDEIFTKDNRFQGVKTSHATSLWCDASDFMKIGADDLTGNKQRKWWNENFKRWTCAWLDFSSPICSEIIHCCKRLELYLAGNVPSAPVAITFMMGREDAELSKWIKYFSPGQDKLEDRATFLRVLFESNRYWTADPIDYWSYKSAGGAPIGVATFNFINRRYKSQPEE